METGVQVWLITSVGSFLSLFHANYKVKYNLCADFIRCLDGALISSEVNTLNSSGSVPRKNVDKVVIYRPSYCCYLSAVMKKTSGVTLSFFIGRHEKKHKG